jgi:hypothetical protein
MSDFSDLCPLFNTAVYSEIQLPYISLVSRTTSQLFAGLPAFSRSVIVTHAYVKKHTTFAATCTALKVELLKAATWATAFASKTVFASLTLSSTVTTQIVGKYLAMTVTAKTFGATDVLNVLCAKSEAGARHVDIMVRYKEK